MTCGCTSKAAPLTHERLAERATLCLACPERHAMTTCSLNGRPLSENVKRGVCPDGRFPDKDGVVGWLGVRWYGVPAPIRWVWNVIRLGKMKKLPGCGCIKFLRDLMK